MLRKALTISAVLLLVATGAAWVRSYSRLDLLVWTKGSTQIEWVGHRGRMGVTVRQANFPADYAFGLRHESVPASRAIVRPAGHGPGVSWRTRSRSTDNGPTVLTVVVPFWLPTTLLAALAPAAWMSAVSMRRRRHRHGYCLRCGYNLTGNQTGICPECAEPISRPRRSGRAAPQK